MRMISAHKRSGGLLADTVQVLPMGRYLHPQRESGLHRKVLADEWLRRRVYEIEQERASGRCSTKEFQWGSYCGIMSARLRT